MQLLSLVVIAQVDGELPGVFAHVSGGSLSSVQRSVIPVGWHVLCPPRQTTCVKKLRLFPPNMAAGSRPGDVERSGTGVGGVSRGVTLAAYTTRGVLFRGDCLEVLTQVESESVDTIFADPPFNLAKCYGNGRSDLLPDEEYLEWCHRWLNECARILKPGGSIFVHNLPKWNVFLAHYLASELKLDFRHWIAIS
ncbi:MAG: hypothetical protein H5T92_05850, partial [Synergistales bacterium]|nr:hypothetical protein [Synergistales bacterium]